MAEIIPAIIPKSFSNLLQEAEKIKDLINCIHVDITDGNIGEGKPSWPFENDRGDFNEILSQKKGLPFWEDVDYEVHLMTLNPLSYVKDWISAGASRIIVHLDSLNYENDIQFLDQIKSEGLVELGLAIDSQNDLEQIKDYLHAFDFIHVMTISSIGAQGLPFDESSLGQIKQLRSDYPHMIISVDGAMNADRIPLVLESEVSRIVVGSYIFKSTNPRETLREIKELL